MMLSNELSLAMRYYEDKLGYCPEDKLLRNTLQTIWFLKVNLFTDADIMQELMKHNIETISIQNLSDSLWNGSLTEKNHYYFHHELQIISPSPVFSLTYGSQPQDDWCVPRIRFTIEDLTNYFWYKISSVEREMWILGHDMNKEIQYLLNRFKTSIFDIEPLDYLLFLLDEMIHDENKQNIKGLISVTNYIGNTLETYRNTILEAKAKGFDKPRWPSCF